MKEILRFVTDLPKSPRDMVERLKKVPLWYKAASVVTIASLAACQLGEKFGFVTPPSEGTKTTSTETVPPTEQLSIDINSIPVEKDSFAEIVVNGEVYIGIINRLETDAVWPKAEKALFAVQSQENILPGTPYELKGQKIIDAGGHEQISLFADVNDGEKVFFYVETDQKGHFTPVDAQDSQSKGRMLRMDVWSDGVSSFLGFENGEEKLPVFELDGNNKVYYIDPFSGARVEVTGDNISAGMSKVLFSLKPVEPTPTPEAPPAWVDNLPVGMIAVHNVDGTWGIGIDEGEQTKAIQGILVNATGFHLTSDGGQIDVTTAEMAKRLKVGQASPLQIYNEAETAILYAFDAENKVWVDATKVLQPDRTNPENYIKIQTWDDLKELARKEKMVLLPFPENTYFPPLDKIYRDYNDYDKIDDSDAEYKYYTPFGSLPEGMISPFRIVNFIILEKNEGRQYDGLILIEQVFNPDDGSFSLLQFGPVGIDDPIVISDEGISLYTEDGRFLLPTYKFYSPNDILLPSLLDEVAYLQENGYMDSSGNQPQVKQLVEEWFNNGHVPQELESIPLDPNVGTLK